MPDLLVNTSRSKDENFESLEGNLNGNFARIF